MSNSSQFDRYFVWPHYEQSDTVSPSNIKEYVIRSLLIEVDVCTLFHSQMMRHNLLVIMRLT
jgi:hypothetical protein